MNLCAFILECTQGRGRLTGAFLEQTIAACSYRGELLGLMAIHLILLSVKRVSPTLMGSVHIYSDCLGALDKFRNLPPHRIPSKCRHSNILKNVMLHCGSMSFTRQFSHVSAHQDDRTKWENLTRAEQSNCTADFGAKRVLLRHDAADLPRQQKFPLEAVCVWAGREKMTSDTAIISNITLTSNWQGRSLQQLAYSRRCNLTSWTGMSCTAPWAVSLGCFRSGPASRCLASPRRTMNSPVGQHSAHFALAVCRSERPAHTSSTVLMQARWMRS